MLFGRIAAGIVALLGIGVSACGGGEAVSTSTITVTATVTQTATAIETVTASAAATEVAEATTPPALSSAHVGLVWSSQVDPGRINQPAGSQPTFDAGDGIVVRLEMLLFLDATGAGDLASECADEIDWSGKPDDTHCLFAQWSFDVPADYAADDAGLSPGPLLTPDGRQITVYTTNRGVPGAKNVAMNATYSGGVPGSTLRWDVGSNKQGWKTLKYEVPEVDTFLPLTFD